MHFHRWSNWSMPFTEDSTRSVIQERICLKCFKIESKRIRAGESHKTIDALSDTIKIRGRSQWSEYLRFRSIERKEKEAGL